MEYVDLLRQLNTSIATFGATRAGARFDGAHGTAALGELARAIRLLQAEQVAVAASCESAGAFGVDGFKDAASWLKARHGVSGRDAKNVGDAATAVLASPEVADAIASGALSAENAASLKDLAGQIALGETDSVLLDELLARGSQQADAFRKDVKRTEIFGTGDEEAAALKRRARSKVTSIPSDGAMMTLIADLDPERHAVVLNAVDAIVNEIWRAGRGGAGRAAAAHAAGGSVGSDSPNASAGFGGLVADSPNASAGVAHSSDVGSATAPSRELSQLRADALVEMARRSLVGTDSGTSEPASSSTSREGEAQVVVLVDFETLRDGVRRADSRCELDDGTPISPEAIRRIACNAGIIPVVMSDGSEPLDLGRKARLATKAQVVAARTRSRTCEFDECTAPAKWCDLHHIEWWFRDRGMTNMDNLALLCAHHHHAVHEGGWKVFRNKDGPGVNTQNPDGVTIRNGVRVLSVGDVVHSARTADTVSTNLLAGDPIAQVAVKAVRKPSADAAIDDKSATLVSSPVWRSDAPPTSSKPRLADARGFPQSLERPPSLDPPHLTKASIKTRPRSGGPPRPKPPSAGPPVAA